MASSSACLAPNSRVIMSGFPGYPHSNQITQAEAESFANQLLMAGWPLDQSLRADYAAQPGSPRSKEVVGISRSDVQLRRDIGSSSGAGLSASHIAELQLQHQHLGGSSGPGSDTGGSGQHQSYQDEVHKPAKRGRGRQRKNTGVETAQQRAHRRFYERKKQRMSALEQEARDKQDEYQQLLAINTELRRKHEALERAVAGRDEHLILIQALGSLSLDTRGRQHPQHQPMPTLQEQPQVPRAPQQQHQQALQQQHLHSRPSAMQPPPRVLDSRSQGARLEPSPQPPAELMPEVEEAGPFGLIQLPQYGSAEADVLPPAAAEPTHGTAGRTGSAARHAPAQGAAAAGPACAQQQQQMSWAVEDDDLPLPAVQQHQHQDQLQLWPTGGFLDLLEGQSTMSLTRSLSMPARTGGFDTDLCPARQQHADGSFGSMLGGAGVPPAGAGGPRSFSTTPGAWPSSRAGPIRTTSHAAAEGVVGGDADADWELGGVFGTAAREGGVQQQQLPRGSSRHYSWSGASAADSFLTGILPKASLSFAGLAGPPGGQQAPTLDGSGRQAGAGLPGGQSSHASQLPAAAQLPGGLDFAAAVGAAVAEPQACAGGMLQGQQQEPKAWLQQLQQQGVQHEAPDRQARSMWGTITTAGPLLAPEPCQQQMQPQELPRADASTSSFGGFQPQPAPWAHQQQQQQGPHAHVHPQSQAYGMMPPPQPVPTFHASQQQQQRQPGMPQQQQHQQQLLQPRRSALQQPEPQQVVQQLQQMGDMAFSADLTVQLATADMPDDVLLFDTDMMDMLMERMSQQQSVEMLSPLPSIPSALLTGDSFRQAIAADPHFAAAFAANSPPGAHAHVGGAAAGQQQPDQYAAHGPGMLDPAATAAAGGGQYSPPGPVTLLEASRQLQARHMAAGFYPSRGANEMFYVHEIVDWYKSKLQQLQQLLPFVDRPCPDVPCSLSLVQTMEEVIDGTRKFGTRNRIGLWEMKLINLETGDFEEASPAHWAMVAEHIQLPPQMRESAISCYTLYLEYVEKVKEDRIAILRDFNHLEQQLDAANAATIGSGVAPPTLLFRVDGYEEYQQLLERLQLSLKREHMVANMLSYSLSQISSHVQMAKGMLACWPYWPDGPSVLSFWLADEQARGLPRGAVAGAPAGPSSL